ncbi:MAG TPA: glycosyltransferase family 39 protein [bacterium]|nr:glycosyltransferase family 39 protein [bacterium]
MAAHRQRPSVLLEIILVGLACIIYLGVQLQLAWSDSTTSDEPVHLLSGYLVLTRGDYTVDPEHPVLIKAVAALPLLVQNIAFDDELENLLQTTDNYYYDARRESMAYADRWLYLPGNQPELMVYSARLMMIGLSVLYGLSLYGIGRQLFGKIAGFIALMLLFSDPNLLAHGHLINTDVGVAFGYLLTVFSWGRFLERKTRGWFLASGVALGFAVLGKFSAVALGPLLIVMAVVRFRVYDRLAGQQFFRSLGQLAFWCLGLAGMTFLMVWAAYGLPFTPDRTVIETGHAGEAYWLVELVPLQPFLMPAHFFKGLWLLLRDMYIKREAFLFGQTKQGGWWYYFPVAFIVKTTIPVLLAGATACCFWLKRRSRISWNYAMLLLAPVFFMFVSILGTMNIGHRHIFPVYPFLYLLLGAAAAVLLRRITAVTGGRRVLVLAGFAGFAVWQAWTLARSYPMYIAYFNEMIPADQKWLVLNDSNLDWGQNAREIRNVLDQYGINHLYCTYYWSIDQLRYHGTDCEEVTTEAEYRDLPAGAYYLIDSFDLKKPEWSFLRNEDNLIDRRESFFLYKI